MPLGVAGELHIGGVQVARGYLNRPELTAERFIADPFGSDPQGRLYKTGDLGRYRADGTLEYLGRNDFQVKIRGFRIELGEIESRLRGCAGVREAVVLAREDQPGDKRLVAYVVADDGMELSSASLREQLLRELAEYMVPSAYVVLEQLPLTPNGKLDRAALPAPDASAVVSRVYEAPVGEVEQAIAQVWQELLGLERVGRHDHFFELGGHSLLVVAMIERLRQRDLKADVRMVFVAPTLLALAAAMGVEVAPAQAVPVNRIASDCERPGRGVCPGRRVQRPGYLSARSAAGRHPVPPPAARAGGYVPVPLGGGLRQPRSPGTVPVGDPVGDRPPRHPA